MKMMTEKQLSEAERIAFQLGMDHAVRRLLETKTIVHGPEGYGSAMKRSVDPGKQDQIDAVVFELLHSQ